MLSIDEIRDAMQRDGYMVQDELLPRSVYNELDRLVLESWRCGIGWNTRVKGPSASRLLPLQTGARLQQVAHLIDRVMDEDCDSFTYLYHQLHNDRDEDGLVRRIEEATCAAWHKAILHLIGHFDRTNFSLTAFTPGCRLERHTDYGGNDAYRMTMLLYFTGEGTSEVPLMFGDGNAPTCIRPLPNRSVIFIPSASTSHWISPVPFEDDHTVRLAFSGWLL